MMGGAARFCLDQVFHKFQLFKALLDCFRLIGPIKSTHTATYFVAKNILNAVENQKTIPGLRLCRDCHSFTL